MIRTLRLMPTPLRAAKAVRLLSHVLQDFLQTLEGHFRALHRRHAFGVVLLLDREPLRAAHFVARAEDALPVGGVLPDEWLLVRRPLGKPSLDVRRLDAAGVFLHEGDAVDAGVNRVAEV